MRLLARDPEVPADVLLRVLADVVAGDRHAAGVRVEEAEQQVRDRRLARLRSDRRARPCAPGASVRRRSRTIGCSPRVRAPSRLPARPSPRAAVAGSGSSGSSTAGLRSMSSSTRRPTRASPTARARPRRAGRPRRTTRARAARASRRGRGRAPPLVGRADADREDPGRRQARDEDRERVPEPGGERVPAAEARELAVELADPRERRLLPAVDDELRRAAEELDELGGQLAARGGLASSGCPREDRREPRDGDAGDEQPDSEDHRGDGQERGGDPDAGGADDERDERRPEPAHVEPLQRVDVADHAREQIAAAVALELRRRERLDPLVERARGSGRAPRSARSCEARRSR